MLSPLKIVMSERKINLLIGGPAGAGVEKAGRTLTLAFVRSGYHVFANVEHESRIRGGNNFLRLRVEEKQVNCHEEDVDIMIALDLQTILEHFDEMRGAGGCGCGGCGCDQNGKGVVIFDNETISLPEGFDDRGVKMLGVPLKRLAIEKLNNPLMENVIALGAVTRLIDLDISVLKNVLKKTFEKKSAEVVKLNQEAAQIGFDIVPENFVKDFPVKMPAKKGNSNMFLMGNDAVCLGAIKAGCKYVGAYPMTPASSILHFMAAWAKEYGIVVKHTEDEIAAVCSVIGAGFAGARAMTATSGGGFALMTEGIGLAGMNEVPIVVVNVMRPGPATGQPTRTDQGDLRQIMHAAQGDPLKIVLLPGDINECFLFAFEAFNLAEKYQIPVIIGYDKYLGESYFTIPPFEDEDLRIDRGKLLTEKELSKIGDYKRYLRTEDGISPRAIPGMKGGIHRATSDEHNEYGDIFEDNENRKLMVEKRMKKVNGSLRDTFAPELIGEKNAEVTFVTWGSCKGVCLDAVSFLALRGAKANVLQIKTAIPFHKNEVSEILKKCKRPILVEHNFSGQMGGVIAENTGIVIDEKILRYDGRPMTAKYIVKALQKLITAKK